MDWQEPFILKNTGQIIEGIQRGKKPECIKGAVRAVIFDSPRFRSFVIVSAFVRGTIGENPKNPALVNPTAN
jgi:hypothetical protein